MEDDDIHERTAKARGISRQAAKRVNFSTLYRTSISSLARRLRTYAARKTPLQEFTEEVFKEEPDE